MEPTQLMIEYIKGIMIVSTAFITVAGIIFAVSINKKVLNRWGFGLLLLSIFLGAASITTALKWFSAPNDYTKNWSTWLLLFQFIAWYSPALVLFIEFWHREGNKDKEKVKVKNNPLNIKWKEILWNLFGPSAIVIILTLIWVYFLNKDKESLNQLMQATMIASAVLIALPNTFKLSKLSKISNLNEDEKKDRRRAIIMIIPGLLTLISALLWFALTDSVYCAIAVGFFLVQLYFIAFILARQWSRLK